MSEKSHIASYTLARTLGTLHTITVQATTPESAVPAMLRVIIREGESRREVVISDDEARALHSMLGRLLALPEDAA
ncbi:MAG: hypothetical protein M0Z85_08065 [Gammaproteobacteria bacterium]|nr:hypothetical protein [Gammaproteobacteria bacterium]